MSGLTPIGPIADRIAVDTFIAWLKSEIAEAMNRGDDTRAGQLHEELCREEFHARLLADVRKYTE